jgi:hypothetical protein
MNLLDKQVSIYALDTGNFYSNTEAFLHWKNHKLRNERNQLINGYIIKNSKSNTRRIIGLKEIENEFVKHNLTIEDIELIQKQEHDFSQCEKYSDELVKLSEQYYKIKNLIAIKNKAIKKTKDDLLQLLKNKVEANIQSNGKHHIRELKENQVSSKNIISVFDSSFTRMIGAKPDEFCEDFVVIQTYYFSIIQDLIYYGFTYKGEKYIYFTSSAGQIRTKKCVFVKESVWNKYEKTIMCGLTIDEINKKGGNNPNKHLAYLALVNSATDVWEEFDINKTIVIDDFETNVFGTYDLVDDIDYSIKRVSDYVPIVHTDGAGMILPNAFNNKQCNKMVRLPWIKGLLGVFDFRKFIEINNCSPIIKDIYDVEHNILTEDIQIVFTKSQFKLWKYYDSWEQYKEYYKQYNCTAGYTNPEEDRIKDATINYQMLQSLTDITDEEIDDIIKESKDRLQNICSSIDSIKSAFGATPYNQNKTALQNAVILYPELLNDVYIRNKLKDIKDSMIKNYKAGKLQVHGKYTFILPDLYAACQYWFMGIKEPDGLLEDGEVFCWLFKKSEKVDCLRSPHLYCEHSVRRNIACNKYEDRQHRLREWYCTNAIYTSCKDLISKILQFDVDGDKALVVTDKTIINVAERNIKKYNIAPLYYNMRKANPSVLNNETIYNGLSEAFTGSNIGIYSNNISKIWNNEVFIYGTPEQRQEAIDVIKLLCMENNFKIDYAKTLYMPERPPIIKDRIVYYTNVNVPHFFKYAKDKEDCQVAKLNNSFVNKLENKTPNPRINCKYTSDGKTNKLGKPDYTLMMSDPEVEVKIVKSKNGQLIEGTNPVVLKYIEKAKEYWQKINATFIQDYPRDALTKTQIRKEASYNMIMNEVKHELSQFGYNDYEVADILVKYLYGIKESKYKDLLWTCYGEYILENLEKHFKLKTKVIQCIDCGEWFEVGIKDTKTCRCSECQKEYRNNYQKELMRKKRKMLADQI